MQTIEVKSDGFRGWDYGAYGFAFVYHPTGNVLLKGYNREVTSYIEANHPNSLVNYVFYRSGKSRYWNCLFLNGLGHYIGRQIQPNGKRKFYIHINGYPKLLLKRLPRKWIPEFDVFNLEPSVIGKNRILTDLKMFLPEAVDYIEYLIDKSK